jgi:hypothetical protein
MSGVSGGVERPVERLDQITLDWVRLYRMVFPKGLADDNPRTTTVPAVNGSPFQTGPNALSPVIDTAASPVQPPPRVLEPGATPSSRVRARRRVREYVHVVAN